MSLIGALAVLAAMALACQPALAKTDAQKTITVTELPPPDLAANAAAMHEDYVIGPLDTLNLKVFPEADLGGDVRVDASGNIELPLIGEVGAAGKTPHQLATELTAKLGEKYFQSPSVVVAVTQSVTNRYTVTGAVAKPGVYDVAGKTTLMQAIAEAQGVNEFANEHDVVIFRTIHEKRAAAVVNLTLVMKGKVDDPEIYPGDTIVVATSNSKHVLHEIIGVTPILFLLQPLGL
jgi:polysaccharide export outer membrane protein